MSGMDNLAAGLCELAERALERADGVAFMFGEVTRAAPLTINVEQRLLLPADILILTDAVIASVEPVMDEQGRFAGYYDVAHNLSPGDRVLLAKIQGGEAYVILSRAYQTEA